jgi:hypothetical protein
MKTCTKCGEAKPLSEYHANPRNASGLQSNCKACQRAAAKRWRVTNKQHITQYNSAYRASNREAITAQERQYRTTNKEKLAAKDRRRHLSNPNAALMRKQKRRAVARQAEPLWADAALIKLLYATRQYLTQETGEVWHVDHVVPLQGRNVCGLHVHNNLRVVPAKVNLAKGNKFSIN